MKFTTGRPKPRFARAGARDGEAGRRARGSTTLGLIALTLGTGRVSVTVSARVPDQTVGSAPRLHIDLGLHRAHRQAGGEGHA